MNASIAMIDMEVPMFDDQIDEAYVQPRRTRRGSRRRHHNGPSRAAVHLFGGSGHPFSNMFRCHIPYHGTLFATTEHAYQHTKAMDVHNFHVAERIMRSPNPFTAKKAANALDQDAVNAWRLERGIAVMTELIQIKYDVCLPFRELCDATRLKPIVEATRDAFWGGAIVPSQRVRSLKDITGSNHLGRIIMRVAGNINCY